MTAWIDAFDGRAGADLDFPEGGFKFGDWLDPAAPPDQPGAARTPWQCVATAYLARSARIVAQAAEVLGRDGSAVRRPGRAGRGAVPRRVRHADRPGRLPGADRVRAGAASSTCSPPEQRAHAGRLLAEQVPKDGFHIATGFLGTPLVTDALTNAGEVATGLRAAAAAGVPVVAVPGDHGRDDDLGALGLHAPGRLDQPGRDDVVQPLRVRRGGRLAAPHGRRPRPGRAGLPAAADRPAARARASPRPRRRTRRRTGRRRSPWTLDGTAFALEVTVPPNTTAEVSLPDGSAPVEVGSGRHSFTCTVPEPRRSRSRSSSSCPTRRTTRDHVRGGRPAAAVRPRVRRRPGRACRRSRR